MRIFCLTVFNHNRKHALSLWYHISIPLIIFLVFLSVYLPIIHIRTPKIPLLKKCAWLPNVAVDFLLDSSSLRQPAKFFFPWEPKSIKHTACIYPCYCGSHLSFCIKLNDLHIVIIHTSDQMHSLLVQEVR